MLRFKKSFLFIGFAFVCFSSPLFALEAKTIQEVKQTTSNYFSHKNWTPFAASVELLFYTNNKKQSSCLGTFLFDPLRKTLLIDCFDVEGKLVFVLKNDDVDFVLHMPEANKAWAGNIFELEYSEDFNSHFRPLDLYRATSPEPFLESEIMAMHGVGEGIEVEIVKPYQKSNYLARRMIINKDGQVEHESFLTPDGSITTVIVREIFNKMKNNFDGLTPHFYYAPQTILIHPATHNKTVMNILEVKLHQAFAEDAWEMKIPESTVIESINKKRF